MKLFIFVCRFFLLTLFLLISCFIYAQNSFEKFPFNCSESEYLLIKPINTDFNDSIIRSNNETNNFKANIYLPDLKVIELNKKIREKRIQAAVGMFFMVVTTPLLMGAAGSLVYRNHDDAKLFAITGAVTGVLGILVFMDGEGKRRKLIEEKNLILEEYMVLTP